MHFLLLNLISHSYAELSLRCPPLHTYFSTRSRIYYLANCVVLYLLIPSPLTDYPTLNVPESAGWHLWLWRGARALKPAAPLHIVLSATQQNQGLCCKTQPGAALSCREPGQVRGRFCTSHSVTQTFFFCYILLDFGFVVISNNDEQWQSLLVWYHDDRGELVSVQTVILHSSSFVKCVKLWFSNGQDSLGDNTRSRQEQEEKLILTAWQSMVSKIVEEYLLYSFNF